MLGADSGRRSSLHDRAIALFGLLLQDSYSAAFAGSRHPPGQQRHRGPQPIAKHMRTDVPGVASLITSRSVSRAIIGSPRPKPGLSVRGRKP